MEPLPPLAFVDVPALLESSEPQPRVPWFWLGLGVSVGLMVTAAAVAMPSVQLAAAGVAFLTFLALPILMRWTLRDVTAQQRAVAQVGELVQLRRWPEAAGAAHAVLSRPMRSHQLRCEALVFLAAILTRYHQFERAISIHNFLIDNELLAPGGAYGLKIARAMALLRDEHLFDADRAISDLRRAGPAGSAGLALVELYRDVKTGHPADAIRIFEDKLPVLRDQLGHRLGDAYALAARAYDLANRSAEAADAFRRATLLAPWGELCRRYPEVHKLLGRYEPAPAPAELA